MALSLCLAASLVSLQLCAFNIFSCSFRKTSYCILTVKDLRSSCDTVIQIYRISKNVYWMTCLWTCSVFMQRSIFGHTSVFQLLVLFAHKNTKVSFSLSLLWVSCECSQGCSISSSPKLSPFVMFMKISTFFAVSCWHRWLAPSTYFLPEAEY